MQDQNNPSIRADGVQSREQPEDPRPAQSDTHPQKAVAHDDEIALGCPYCDMVNWPLRDDLRCISCRMRLDWLAPQDAKQDAKQAPEPRVPTPDQSPQPQPQHSDLSAVASVPGHYNPNPSHQATPAAANFTQQPQTHPWGYYSSPYSAPQPPAPQGPGAPLQVIQWHPRDEDSAPIRRRRRRRRRSSPRHDHDASHREPANSFKRVSYSAPPGYPVDLDENAIFRRFPGVGGQGESVEIGKSYHGFYETQCFMQ